MLSRTAKSWVGHWGKFLFGPPAATGQHATASMTPCISHPVLRPLSTLWPPTSVLGREGRAQAPAKLTPFPSPATPCGPVPFLCLPYPSSSNNSGSKPEPQWNCLSHRQGRTGPMTKSDYLSLSPSLPSLCLMQADAVPTQVPAPSSSYLYYVIES